MQPMPQFDLYLFDFDGVLVDTEELHFLAYQRMLEQRGFQLRWDFEEYSKIALFKSMGLREKMYQDLPDLYHQEPVWEVLYAEKKAHYLDILSTVPVRLMAGVEELLQKLACSQTRRCVVTHSPRIQIERICERQPILQTIPHWITRECYEKPKPDSECYRHAIQLYSQPGDRIVGFEDSPRGMRALAGTEATPFLITSFLTPSQIAELASQVNQRFIHFPSFIEYCHQTET